MTNRSKLKLRGVTIVYWFLLFYIVAALLWWYISLEAQNQSLAELKIKLLREQSEPGSPSYNQQLAGIQNELQRGTAKYVSEGITFLLLTLVGAAFVYRAVRRHFRLQKQQQNFMMAVTHELKTPISIIQLNLETLQKHNLDAEKQQRIFNSAIQETTRLTDLTNNILVTSQLEGADYKASKEQLDLTLLVNETVDDFEKRFAARHFQLTSEQDIFIRGDELLIKVLINNLLLNAVKYAPENKPIAILLQRSKGKVQLQIIDEGPGIPDEEKQIVFEKFYRIGNEMTRKKPGTGLGLYLCKKIAEAHDAEVSVHDNPAGGSIFIILFR